MLAKVEIFRCWWLASFELVEDGIRDEGLLQRLAKQEPIQTVRQPIRSMDIEGAVTDRSAETRFD
jgi:hypothetical protein